MPKGTATGNLDTYRPIALGQQDMRMLMTPLMRRFTTVVARNGLAADKQFGAMLGSTAAAPVFLAKRRLHQGQEENHVLAFGVSKAFDTAQHGALALLLRHMGVPSGVISSSLPSAAAPQCALLLRMAPRRAFVSTEA